VRIFPAPPARAPIACNYAQRTGVAQLRLESDCKALVVTGRTVSGSSSDRCSAAARGIAALWLWLVSAVGSGQRAVCWCAWSLRAPAAATSPHQAASSGVSCRHAAVAVAGAGAGEGDLLCGLGEGVAHALQHHPPFPPPTLPACDPTPSPHQVHIGGVRRVAGSEIASGRESSRAAHRVDVTAGTARRRRVVAVDRARGA